MSSEVFGVYSRFYDLVYKDKDYVQEAAFIRTNLEKYGVCSGKILELGCGTGRHALELARAGYDVHGVDLSEGMVGRAEAGCASESESVRKRLRFEMGDVRTFKAEPGKFDAVISLFHVASYQTSNEDFTDYLTTARNALRAGGLFLFDFWFGPAVMNLKPESRTKHFESDSIQAVRRAEPEMRWLENVVNVRYEISVTDKASRKTHEFKEVHPMRYFFHPEMRYFLASNGFKLVQFSEWLSDKEPDETTWGAFCLVQKVS